MPGTIPTVIGPGAAAAGLGVFRVKRPRVTLDDLQSALGLGPRLV